MPELSVSYLGGMSFEARSRNHTSLIDLPVDSGGSDAGMTPPEHFIASLGACIGVYVTRYCRQVSVKNPQAGLNPDGMKIRLSWKFSADKTRISDICASIDMPKAQPHKRSQALLEVARHCLIHNTLERAPTVKIELTPSSPAP